MMEQWLLILPMPITIIFSQYCLMVVGEMEEAAILDLVEEEMEVGVEVMEVDREQEMEDLVEMAEMVDLEEAVVVQAQGAEG